MKLTDWSKRISKWKGATGMTKYFIMMVGPAGSGKSTMANNFPYAAVISRDQIRFDLLDERGGDYFDYENEVTETFYNRLNKALNNKHCYMVIADATHCTRKARKAVFDNITIPKDVKVIAFVVEKSLHVIQIQNASREGRERVPEKVIDNMYKNLHKQWPKKEEGFDVIWTWEE